MKSPPRPANPPADRVRLDKWLWAARFYKTRSLSADEIGRGRVQVNGQVAKASREVRVGDTIAFRQGVVSRIVVVTVASDHRGPAAQAQGLFAETAESIEQRARQAAARRDQAEPALAIEQGRPTKRDRRELADWNRWSASIEPD
ncbi:MAG: RNA-binding S4 domain-containing protein [Caldimonas sp.]